MRNQMNTNQSSFRAQQ